MNDLLFDEMGASKIFMDFQRGFPGEVEMSFSSKGNLLKGAIMVREEDKKFVEVVLYHPFPEERIPSLFLIIKGFVDHHVCPSMMARDKLSWIMGFNPNVRVVLEEKRRKNFNLDWKGNIDPTLKVLAWCSPAYAVACERMIKGSPFFRTKADIGFNQLQLL